MVQKLDSFAYYIKLIFVGLGISFLWREIKSFENFPFIIYDSSKSFKRILLRTGTALEVLMAHNCSGGDISELEITRNGESSQVHTVMRLSNVTIRAFFKAPLDGLSGCGDCHFYNAA